MPEDTPRQRRRTAKSRTTFALQTVAYMLVICAGTFWLLSPSTIAVNKLGPYVTPVGGTIATIGAVMATYGHVSRRWMPEQIGAFLVALAAGMYGYSIALDSVSDSTKGMGMCIVLAFFTLCVLRIFQIERDTNPSLVGRRLAEHRTN